MYQDLREKFQNVVTRDVSHNSLFLDAQLQEQAIYYFMAQMVGCLYKVDISTFENRCKCILSACFVTFSGSYIKIITFRNFHEMNYQKFIKFIKIFPFFHCRSEKSIYNLKMQNIFI